MGLRDFVGIVRELSFDQLRADATMSPMLLIVSDSPELAEEWRTAIFGPGVDEFVHTYCYGDSAPDPLQYDLILAVDGLRPSVSRSWHDLYRRVGEPVRLVELSFRPPERPAQIDAIRRRIADVADERALAIGRYIPALRSACAMQVVSDTSMVNGQFALISNVPAVVPIVGNLVAAGADFLVLTKNQLMMIYKLAAVYGRDLDNRSRIYAEMLPVVGAGLAWRTIAREVSALLPLAIGTVPKVAIAYAGTFAAGRAAQVYFEQGTKMNREEMRSLYSEALARLRENPIPLPGRGRDDEESGAVESTDRTA